MNKKTNKLLSILITILMVFGLFPVATFAEERTPVTAVVVNYDFTSHASYGNTSHSSFDIKGENIISGSPAYLSMCGLHMWNGTKWVDLPEGALKEGTYRYEAQLRIDGTGGSTYVLDANTTLSVNGQAWTPEASGPLVFDTFSYRWYYGPEFTIEKPANSPLNVPESVNHSTTTLYVGTAMESFSIASFVTGGTDPITYSKKSGPSWINVSSDGIVSGTPTATGSNDDLVITVTDSSTPQVSKDMTVQLPYTYVTPKNREVITAVEITHDFSTSVYFGSTTYPYTLSLTVDDTTVGQPAHLDMCGLEKNEGGTWKSITPVSGALQVGTYRYNAQLRTDSTGGRTHVISDDTTLKVNGQDWTSSSATQVLETYTFRWYYSPSFEITTESVHTHTGGTATCTAKAICTTCNQPYGELATHSFTVIQYDVNQHWHKCANCDATDTKEDHAGGTATCENKAECSTCHQKYGELSAHTYDNDCDATCNECDATRTAPHNCSPVALIPATVDSEGTKAHYECADCSKLFLDSACTTEVTAADLVIPKLTAPAATFTGIVSITGNKVFNQILTANVSDDNNTGTLSYQWYRGTTAIDGATNNTYRTTIDDVGKQLKCVVSSSIETGVIESTPTDVIPKADFGVNSYGSCELKYKGSAYTVEELVEALDCIARYEVDGIDVLIDGTWNLVDPTVDLTNANTTGVTVSFSFTPSDDRFLSTKTLDNKKVKILKADGPSAPTGLVGVAPTSSADNDGKITGTTTLMEYSTTSEFTIKHDCADTETTGLVPGTYYVRIKETDNTNAGVYATIVIPAFETPTLLSGEGGKYTKGSNTGLTFKSSGEFITFRGIKVDDIDVDSSNYDAQSGSTIISLKPTYLETLSFGEHKLTILSYNDGCDIDTTFTIVEKAKPSTTTYAIPKTGVN